MEPAVETVMSSVKRLLVQALSMIFRNCRWPPCASAALRVRIRLTSDSPGSAQAVPAADLLAPCRIRQRSGSGNKKERVPGGPLSIRVSYETAKSHLI